VCRVMFNLSCVMCNFVLYCVWWNVSKVCQLWNVCGMMTSRDIAQKMWWGGGCSGCWWIPLYSVLLQQLSVVRWGEVTRSRVYRGEVLCVRVREIQEKRKRYIFISLWEPDCVKERAKRRKRWNVWEGEGRGGGSMSERYYGWYWLWHWLLRLQFGAPQQLVPIQHVWGNIVAVIVRLRHIVDV
jgi:hypothetical protein